MQKTNINRLTAALVTITLFICLAASCRGRTGNTVRVGVLYPISGEMAGKGIDSIRALQMAADEINALGGIKSMNGAIIELVYGDTRGNPETGVRETERLINDEKVAAIIGTYQSSVTKQATRVAEELEVPFIVSISTADIITERGFRYTFRIEPKAEYYCRDQARFITETAGERGKKIRRVALLYENTDYGTSIAMGQKKIFREYGIIIVADVSYAARDAKNLKHEVDRVLASKPDAIFTVTYLNDSILIFRELAGRNVTIPVIDAAGGTVSPEFIRILGKDAEFIFSSAEFSKYSVKGKEINKRFYKRYGIDMTGDSAYAYQSLWVLRDSLERSGSTESGILRDSIAATDMTEGEHLVIPVERIRFDKYGQNEYARLFIVQIQDGEYIPVWPYEYANAKARFRK